MGSAYDYTIYTYIVYTYAKNDNKAHLNFSHIYNAFIVGRFPLDDLSEVSSPYNVSFDRSTFVVLCAYTCIHTRCCHA